MLGDEKLCLVALLPLLFGISPHAYAADKPVCQFGDVKTLGPIMKTHTLPPYPEMSVMTNEQGRTLLDVMMSHDGVPTDVRIAATSGSIRLDEAARDHVKQNWRWAPVGEGCAAIETRVSIAWDLKDAPHGPPDYIVLNMKPSDYPSGALARGEKGAVAILVAVQPGGEIANWRVTQGSGFEDLDASALSYVKARHWSPAQMDGQPVFTILQIGVLWGLEGPLSAQRK